MAIHHILSSLAVLSHPRSLIAAFLLTVLMLLRSAPANALFTTPVVDGVINAGEYGSHVDGQNQQSSGGTIWYMTWDNTNLYVGISGAAIGDGAVVYIDKNPIAPINGGNSTYGTLVGQAYDGTNLAALQFRADFIAYFKTNSQEYRTASGDNWSNAVHFGKDAYKDDGPSQVREISIPWSSITGSGRPASFAWFGYVTSSSGSVYGQVPVENLNGNIGTAARYTRYYTVSSTSDASGTPPFSRNSYVFNSTTEVVDFGAISAYDFTMNTVGMTVTRSSGLGGAWNIGGQLQVYGGVVDFGESATPANVGRSVDIELDGALVLSTADGGDISLGGNWINEGVFTPNGRQVTFNGTTYQSISGQPTEFDKLKIDNPSGVSLNIASIVDDVLNLAQGDLFTGSSALEMGVNATSMGVGDVVGTVYRPGLTNGIVYSFGNPTVSLLFSGRGPADVMVNLVRSAPGDLSSAVGRTYTITPFGGDVFSATLRLAYRDSELGGNSEANLQLWRNDGVQWTKQTKTGSNTSANWVEKSGVTAFSRWALASAGPPNVVDPLATSINSTTATLGGTVVDNGGASITERGILYADTDANHNPTIGGTGVTKMTTGGTTGSFTIPASGLSPGTTYSFRAYANNSRGTGYSTVGTFTTLFVTTISVQSSANPSGLGEPVTLAATAASAGPTPTGVMTFTVAGTAITRPLMGGVATYVTDSLAMGSYEVTAAYGGDVSSTPGTGKLSPNQTVNKAHAAAVITAHMPNPSLIEEAVVVSYAVMPTFAKSGSPTGNVTINAGSEHCSGPAPIGACTITLHTRGVVALTASYEGDGNFEASVSQQYPHTVSFLTYLPLLWR